MLLSLVTALAVVLWPERWPQPRREHRRDEQQLLAAIHAELAAGSSLRAAFDAAAQPRPDLLPARRLALAGAPIEDVAAAVGPRELAAALVVAARSGGRAAAVFQRLADRAASAAELSRQRRVLTAQARLSAAIVAGMPLLWMLFGGVGRVQSLFAAGAGAVAAVGVVLELLGVGLIWRLVRP